MNNTTTTNPEPALMERVLLAIEASCLANIGEAYRQQGRNAEAEKSWLEALDLMAKAGPHPDRARVLCSLGCLFLDSGRPAQASAFLATALTFYRGQRAALLAKHKEAAPTRN